MSTYKFPILPFFVHIFLKSTQLSCRRKQFNSPLNSKTKAIAGEKQLNSAPGTKQLDSTGENNSTRQQERNNSTQHCRRPPAPPLQQNRLFLPSRIKEG
ncbi:hypothetical protein TNCV_5002421 [Trichonephila clavipes]|nr:hypothetical protein TNCV_5002421 [Trichonephila clavipes]